eukprot:382877_1
MAQQPQSIAQIYKQFTDIFSPTNNARDVVRFAKRRLSVDLKYGVVNKFLTDKQKWDERICEPLDSEFGQDWYFETIQQSSCYQKWLIDCYFKQKHHTTCSLVSLAIVLNAKLLSNYYLSKYDDEEHEDHKIEFDSDDEEDMDTLSTTLPFLTESQLINIFPQYASRVTIDKVLVSGMSLDELGQVLLDFGCKSVNVQHCDTNDTSKERIATFREICRGTFNKHNMDIDGAIICNFDLWALETGIEGGVYGHMSPIAAYHEDSDRVLLLDTFTDETWVKIESLYQAMSTEHDKTGQYRGYVVVHGTPIWRHCATTKIQTPQTEGYEQTKPVLMNDEPLKSRNKRNDTRQHSPIDTIDFIVFEDKAQNYSDNKRKSGRRSSRRMSKKLNLYLEFESENGQKLWKETQSTEYHQKWIVVEYFQQTQTTTYALVTMAICLNAKARAYHNNDQKQYDEEDEEICALDEEKMMDLYQRYYAQHKENTLHLPELAKIVSNGTCLEETSNVLKLFGCASVEVMYTYQMAVDAFRDMVKSTLKDGSRNNDKVMLVHYDLLKLGTGIGYGAVSVIAGYNMRNDMILLMNTSWIIGKCWVKCQLLYDAMNTIDDTVGAYRGCIVAQGLPMFDL